MTALTLRKIPSNIEKVIRDKAGREHVSLNRAVLEILEESVAEKKKPEGTRHHDLDWMCGILSEKQSASLVKDLAKVRTIDPELWK